MAALSSRRTPGLQRLPYEIMAHIVKYLDIDEIFDLSLSCNHFQYLVREESFCKAIVTAKAFYTVEAREAERSGEYSRALRRVAKRHQALSQASPYVLGIVGLADSYQYIHGVLCYIVESRPRRWLRILDLHGSAGCELVIDIPTLIREAVPRAAKSRKYKFRVLYHANGITSCLFSFALPDTENWLLVFKAEEQRIVAKVQLESTAKIFVRNNKDYLYFGTHSEEGADGFRKWVLTGFRIKDSFWFPRKIHLTTLVGYDIGSTVYFEIIDDYFYGLSNRTDFEIRETNWTSYYHCFRFPLSDPDPKKIQLMEKNYSWRRQHAEGPIDDRWGFLKLERDQASGRLHIIESRKEWLTGQSGSRRSYYITKVVFDSDLEVSEEENTDTELSTADGSTSTSTGTSTSITTGTSTTGTTTVTTNTNGRLSINPIGHLDKPAIKSSRVRAEENVHQGDESSVDLLFTRSQTHLRAYEPCCSTFMDLVDDPSITSSSSRRLRLRTGYRKRNPIHIPILCPGIFGKLSYELSHETSKVNEENQQPYQPNKIYFWPPEQKPSHQNPFLDKVYEILNPPGYLGCVEASSDERSIVYATGGNADGLKALVYISFDPAARLVGILREECILGERAAGDGYNPEASTGGITQRLRDYAAEDKGKQKVIGGHPRWALPLYVSDTPLTSMYTILPPHGGGRSWAWSEKAMYRDLTGKNFTFAC
ncbi:hypothetical protein F4821DRAFT_214923 [Hypoxylon rubiginosum]|uniref:Uncharacterized protein n=1 Tax=Hypoxylon rubiginosum TaxID=110542 RepID=A0ACC0CPM5_9PEZI|nr:hypothetical protein F4821DRAFT_214923 [Hypoxylon rubiginosum]